MEGDLEKTRKLGEEVSESMTTEFDPELYHLEGVNRKQHHPVFIKE